MQPQRLRSESLGLLKDAGRDDACPVDDGISLSGEQTVGSASEESLVGGGLRFGHSAIGQFGEPSLSGRTLAVSDQALVEVETSERQYPGDAMCRAGLGWWKVSAGLPHGQTS